MNIQHKDIIIVIPIHRAELTPDEQVSVSQCTRILGDYAIRFVCPESVKAVKGFEHIPVEHFDAGFFKSVADYNRLMLTQAFYERFALYDYILIHQTDAFVFRDELQEWVEKGYSYIGAPWILKAKYRTWWGKLILHLRSLRYLLRRQPFRPLLLGDKIGNGGLSLRRTADFIRVCASEKEQIAAYLQKSEQWSEYNEDAFWATRPSFTYPTTQEGLLFAFDVYPEECLEQTQHTLPFGCHGWNKENVNRFWKPIIDKQTGKEPLRVYFDYQAFTHQSFGGVSRYYAEIIRRLPQYGIEPIVGIRYSNNTHLKALGLDTRPAPNRKSAKYLNRFYCRQEILEGQFDMIHATYFDPYVLKANKRHKPLVITIHDMIDEVMGEGHYMPRRKALLADKATRIIAVSEHTKQDVMSILNVAEERISVVYHGNSIVPVRPEQMPRLPKRYILYVGGRQRKYKNFDLFLRAMQPIVQKEGLDLVCVGAPFSNDEITRIKSLGLEHNIYSLFAEEDQLYTIYHHAGCFVFPSCYEGFGLPILEAWSAECPLILSNSSCFPEIAGDGAAYFEENDAADLTRQTWAVLQSPRMREQLISRGKTRLNDFSWDKAAKKTAQVYHQLYRRYV